MNEKLIARLIEKGLSDEQIVARVKINSHLELYNLVEVSNNSRITNELLEILNTKLEGNDFRVFQTWLRIVKDNQR